MSIFKNKFTYFYMVLAGAIAVPAMAQSAPDQTDNGDIIVSVPASALPASEKKEQKEATSADTDKPKYFRYGFFNFGGTYSHSDVNANAGGGSMTVGGVTQDGGKIQATVKSESKDYFTVRADVTDIGVKFVCEKSTDPVCITLAADLQAQYGVGTKTGEFHGSAGPGALFRFKVGDDTQVGVRLSIKGGGTITGRLLDNGEPAVAAGVKPGAAVYIMNKYFDLNLGGNYQFNFIENSPTKGIAGANGSLHVPFFKKTNSVGEQTLSVGAFTDWGVSAVVTDNGQKTVFVPTETVTKPDARTPVEVRGVAGIQMTF